MFHLAWADLWRSVAPNARARGASRRSPFIVHRLEALEVRLAPAVVGLVQAGAVAANAAWLNDVAKAVLDTTLSPSFVARTADRMARGLAPRSAMFELLKTPEARLALSQAVYRSTLGRDARGAELVGPQSAPLRQGQMVAVVRRIVTSPEYYDQEGGTSAGFRAAVARDLLGATTLPDGLARRPVATASQRRELVDAILKTGRFDRAWAASLADHALVSGSFPSAIVRAATREIRGPLGSLRALARFLATPESRGDVARRAEAPAPVPSQSLKIGDALPFYFGVDRRGLVPDPVTDPIAYNDPAATRPSISPFFVQAPSSPPNGVPINSPWGAGLVFPAVDYATIAAGGAVQPTLTLPPSLATQWPAALNDPGITFQAWFQAKSPGSLLSGTIALGTSATEVPLVFINASGNVVAGLFDGTALSPKTGLTLFGQEVPVGGGSTAVVVQVGAPNPLVSQVRVLDNTWHHVMFTATGAKQSLYVDGLLQGELTPTTGSYTFTPTIKTGPSASGPSAFAVGGTIVPEATDKARPQINYPQGFVGTIDEVGTWTTALGQEMAQEAMTAPIAKGTGLQAGLVDYFDFNQWVTTPSWPNRAPSGSGAATGPVSGTQLASVATTIPTDPFPDSVPRLAGSRAWGLHLMTPLSTSNVEVSSGATVTFKVALAAGDQLRIDVPDSDKGRLLVSAQTDTASTASIDLIGGETKALRATRTGTYLVTLGWTPGPTSGATVALAHVPGPLNDLMAMLTSYTRQGQFNTIYTWAYSDPTLPGHLDNSGFDPGDVAAAGYWPLWSDATVFPAPSGVAPGAWAAALSDAYAALVARSPNLSNSGYANVIGVTFTGQKFSSFVQNIQSDLQAAYAAARVGLDGTAARALDAVHDFVSAANGQRQTLYNVLGATGSGTLHQWVDDYLAAIGPAQGIPQTIVGDIVQGQGSQVTSLKFDLSSEPMTSGQVLGQAAVSAAGGVLSAIAGLASVGFPILGALFAGAGATIASDLIGAASGSSDVTVPVTPITTVILGQATLDTLATNIVAASTEQWTNLRALVESQTFVQTYLSNYGLLRALGPIDGTQLTPSTVTNTNRAPSALTAGPAAKEMLTQMSWRTMVPAIFHWTEVSPTDFAPADGRTTNVAIGPPIEAGNLTDAWDVVAANFKGTANLDLLVTNYTTGHVTLLPGNGDGTFGAGQAIPLGRNQYGPRGIAVADFNGDHHPDAATANWSTDDVSLLMNDGTGNFTSKLVSLDGPDSAIDITAGHFYGPGTYPDLAVANYDGRISILKNDGSGNFPKSNNIRYTGNAGGPKSIASGDLDGDGFDDLAMANFGSDNLTVLMNQKDGSFKQSNYSLNGPDDAIDAAIADLDGDGNLDIAVIANRPNVLEIFYGDGTGNFLEPAYRMSLNSDSSVSVQRIAVVPVPGSRFPTLAITYGTLDSGDDRGGVDLVYSNGPRAYFPFVDVVIPGSFDTRGIAVANFSGGATNQVAVVNGRSASANLLSFTNVGNFVTFLPASSDATGAASLANLQHLQGGNDVRLGPINGTGSITPPTTRPPDYLGYVGLPFVPGQGSIDTVASNVFLTSSQAQLNQSALGSRYQGTGSILSGWTLHDGNHNPIAPNLWETIFGVPTTDLAVTPPIATGTRLAPLNPNQPASGLNGGWYFASARAPGAVATWADAFFNWGPGVAGYSNRTLIPYFNPSTGQGQTPANSKLTNPAYTFPGNFSYSITYLPQTSNPPSVGTPVDLSSAFNIRGITTDGATFSNTDGLDRLGRALPAGSLPRSAWYNGSRLELLLPDYTPSSRPAGQTDTPNAIASAGQVIALPFGSYTKLHLLGSGVNGNQKDVTFLIHYTDGTQRSVRQSMSDWYTDQKFNGETPVLTTAYRNLAAGTIQQDPFNVYGYTFDLLAGKTVKSITLPSNANAVVLAISLA